MNALKQVRQTFLMNCIYSMDFDDQLDLFVVRKKTDLINFTETKIEHNKKYKEAFCSYDIKNCIPLMLKHVKSLNKNWEDTNVLKIFSDKLQFKHCLVYGTIMGKRKESKSNHCYILEDGTASIDVNIFRGKSDMETIWKMENELDAIKGNMLAQNKKEIINSLRNLLFQTKQQIDDTNIPIGSKVLLYGKPTYYRGQISLNVYCFIVDEKPNRDIEISFKDYLINWYRENCF